MPQHDLIIDNGSGAAVRADLNAALAALGSNNKGPNAPSAPLAGMMWVDDDTPSATVWTLKQYDGAEWIELGRLDITANVFTPSEGVIAWADVASAATVDLGAQASRSLRITGTTGITSFGTAASGVRRQLRFAAALTLTHNATSLILPGGADITTAAGDTADAYSLGSGNWVVVDWQPAAGYVSAGLITAGAMTIETASLLGRFAAGTGAIQRIGLGNTAAAVSLGINQSAEQATTSGTAIDFTGIPAGVRRFTLLLNRVSTNGTSPYVLRLGTSASVEATGYEGVAREEGVGQTQESTGVVLVTGPGAANTYSGRITGELISGDIWLITGLIGRSNLSDGRLTYTSYAKTLSGTLDRLRLTTVGGANNFDAGTARARWEF